MKPQFVVPGAGIHNENLDATIERLKVGGTWKRMDTVIVIPAAGTVPTKAVASWMNMICPPNQSVYRMFALGMEVGEAYQAAIENILAHPDLSKFKYVLCLEHDNVIPPDGFVELLEAMENHPEFDVIGGLYHLKGPGGVAQIWGDPRDPTPNFRPQVPVPGQLVECCGTGQGFTLYRLDMFKDPDLSKPWFKTQTDSGVCTQDLFFAQKARAAGYRFAIDCRVLVGHLDHDGKFGPPDTIW